MGKDPPKNVLKLIADAMKRKEKKGTAKRATLAQRITRRKEGHR